MGVYVSLIAEFISAVSERKKIKIVHSTLVVPHEVLFYSERD